MIAACSYEACWSGTSSEAGHQQSGRSKAVNSSQADEKQSGRLKAVNSSQAGQKQSSTEDCHWPM